MMRKFVDANPHFDRIKIHLILHVWSLPLEAHTKL